MNLSLRNLPTTHEGNQGVVDFVDWQGETQIWTSKPTQAEIIHKGVRINPTTNIATIQCDHASPPILLHSEFVRPTKRARLDEKKIENAQLLAAVMGVGTALEKQEEDEEKDDIHQQNNHDNDDDDDNDDNNTATPKIKQLTKPQDFQEGINHIKMAIQEMDQIGYLANYIEGRGGAPIIGVKKLHNTQIDQDFKSTTLAISAAKKHQQLTQASIHFEKVANALELGRAAHSKYFEYITVLHKTWMLKTTKRSPTEFIVDCGYKCVGSEWKPKWTIEKPRILHEVTRGILRPNSETGEIIVTPPSKCNFVTMRVTIEKRNKKYQHQIISKQSIVLWKSTTASSTSSSSSSSSSPSSSSSSSSSSSFEKVSLLLKQIRHSSYIEECYDTLMHNVQKSNKAQKISGTSKLIHQDGYVVLNTASQNEDSINIVIDNLPECDVFLSFTLVPIGTTNDDDGDFMEEEQEENEEEKIEAAEENELLLKVAVQLVQLCIRYSWKVPTLLSSTNNGNGKGKGKGGKEKTLQHRDVLYSIVRALRYFLTFQKRKETLKTKQIDGVKMFNNIKQGEDVLENL